jgi:hypothetical protein
MSEDIVKRLRVPPDLMTDFGRAGLFGEAAEEIERLRARVGDLTDALIDARCNGLIYWSPMTERGAVERAKMMARIDKVLNKEVKP